MFSTAILTSALIALASPGAGAGQYAISDAPGVSTSERPALSTCMAASLLSEAARARCSLAADGMMGGAASDGAFGRGRISVPTAGACAAAALLSEAARTACSVSSEPFPTGGKATSRAGMREEAHTMRASPVSTCAAASLLSGAARAACS